MSDRCLCLSLAKWGLMVGLPEFTSHGERSPSRSWLSIVEVPQCFSDIKAPLCDSVVNLQYEITSSLALSHLQFIPPNNGFNSLNKSGPCERQ